MCVPCVTKLNNAVAFKESTLNSNKRLKRILLNQRKNTGNYTIDSSSQQNFGNVGSQEMNQNTIQLDVYDAELVQSRASPVLVPLEQLCPSQSSQRAQEYQIKQEPIEIIDSLPLELGE